MYKKEEYILSALNNKLKGLKRDPERQYVYIECKYDMVSALSKYIKINFKSIYGEFAIYTNPLTGRQYDLYVIPYDIFISTGVTIVEIPRNNIKHIKPYPFSIFKSISLNDHFTSIRAYSQLLNSRRHSVFGKDWIGR